MSALASVADSAPHSLVIAPLLPELKLEQGVVDAIVFGHPVPRKFESVFCPGETSSAREATLLAEDILSRVKEQEGEGGRRLNIFSHFGVVREMSNHDRTLQGKGDSELCRDVFGGLVSRVSDKGESFSFELQHQSTHENVRTCLLLLVLDLAAQPEISWLGVVPDMVPLNSEAQWVSQSRQQEWRPFFDVGLDGTGQVIGVSDTGLDTDNCYFWDATGEVPKDGVSACWWSSLLLCTHT